MKVLCITNTRPGLVLGETYEIMDYRPSNVKVKTSGGVITTKESNFLFLNRPSVGNWFKTKGRDLFVAEYSVDPICIDSEFNIVNGRHIKEWELIPLEIGSYPKGTIVIHQDKRHLLCEKLGNYYRCLDLDSFTFKEIRCSDKVYRIGKLNVERNLG